MNKLLFSFLCFVLSFFSLGVWALEEDLPPPPVREQGFMQTMVMITIALVFFYFILWRPEQKRRKILDEQRNNLQKGVRVTAMGIVGIVSRVQEETVILKMVDGAKIEVLKAAITDVRLEGEEKSNTASEERGNKRVELAKHTTK